MLFATTVFFVPLGLVVIIAVLIYLNISRKKIKNVPHPPMWPLLGNGHLFLNNTPPGILLLLKSLLQRYGKRFQVALGPDLIFFTTDAKDFEVVLSSNSLITKAQEYDVLRNWLGDGLLLSSGKKWHTRRKAITPAFHFKILEQFTDIFDQQSDLFVNQILSRFEPHSKVDIYPLITLLALDVICETAMGAKVNAQMNSDSEYVRAVKEVTYILHLRMFDLLLRWDPYYKLSALARREKKALKTLHTFTDAVIASRRKELEEQRQGKDSSPEADFGIKRKMNLIDLLLQTNCEGRPLTNLEIREEVDTFMFEGHDTTTSAIAFAVYMLAKHPEAQEKAYQEVIQMLGKEKDTPTSLHSLNELNYLELCIKETLRLFPSVPVFARKVIEDVEINGAHIKSGTSIVAGCHFMQRDPDYFPEAEEFKPERFLEERSTEKSSPYVYVPFSAGPRNCIGQKFAMYEMKSTLSKILRYYEFSVDKSYEGPVLVAELILKPENGVLVNLRRR